MPTTVEGIRGAALRPFVNWYTDTYGRAGLQRALAILSADDRRCFDVADPGLGISVATWYPAALVHRVLDGLLDGMDPPARTALAASGADQTLAGCLTGYLGTAFRALVSPPVCALVGPRIWHAFYSGGRVRIDTRGRRCHVMEVTGWPGHHAFLCEMNNAAGRAIYRAAGCTAVRTEHAACIAREQPSCVYVIRW